MSRKQIRTITFLSVAILSIAACSNPQSALAPPHVDPELYSGAGANGGAGQG